MRRAVNGRRLFARARERAIDRLGSIESARRRASVVMVSESPRPLLPEPTSNTAALIDRLQNTSATFQRGRMKAALAKARAMHESQGETAHRGAMSSAQLVIISDAQATHWPAKTIAHWRNQGASVKVHRIDGSSNNVAVHSLRVDAASPVAGETVTVSARVANYGAAARKVAVRLASDALLSSPIVKEVELAGGDTRALRWSVTFNDVGPASVTATLANHVDALDADDQTGTTFRVARAQPIVLVSQNARHTSSDVGYFLERALRSAPNGGRSKFAVITRRPDQLKGSTLQDDPLLTDERADGQDRQRTTDETAKGEARTPIVIVTADELPVAAQQALMLHIQRGGGVFWLVDSPAGAETFNGFVKTFPEDAGRTLPKARWVEKAKTNLSAARFERSPLNAFTGAAREGLLDQTFAGRSDLTGVPSAARLLLTSAGHTVASRHTINGGRLLVLGLDLSPARTQFARSPWFVMLMRESMSWLGKTPKNQARLIPGQSIPGDIPRATRVIDPSGAATRVTNMARVTRPGLYQWQDASGRLVAQRWVAFPRSESDLTPHAFKPAAGAAKTKRKVTNTKRAGSDVQSKDASKAAEGESPGMLLWPLCFAAALVLLALEPVARLLLTGRR